MPSRTPRSSREVKHSSLALAAAVALAGGPQTLAETERAVHRTVLTELNEGPCLPGQKYQQAELREPMKIAPSKGNVIETELVVRIRERCVPVWVATPTPHWEMQTLKLRTYGFPRVPGQPITEKDADDPNSPKIAWSAPGPTFIATPATKPGVDDGTKYKMRLYNRMPHDGDPHACETSLKCNTRGPNAGVDPATGKCKVPPDPAQGGVPPFIPHQTVNGKVVEPPNCFHGANSTNFHFHGFHVSPQLGQDFVGLELRPPLPQGQAEADMPHATHGDSGVVAYGHFDYDVDRLRYTQAPGTHWYHAHKHGSTALHVLNGLVGTFEVRGEFDERLDHYFAKNGGGKLRDRLMVVQQLQERQPGLGGADQTGAVLVNGQANPIVTMEPGEIQRWRFIGATMQASAALRVGFPDVKGLKSPEVRQIAMDGVQFSRENYACQPFLKNPDCSEPTDESSFDELTSFDLSPGNRIDVLVQAPLTPGLYCMVHDITTRLHEESDAKIRGALVQRAAAAAGTCGLDPNTKLAPLFTLKVEAPKVPRQAMRFPSEAEFPNLPKYLDDIPPVTKPALQRNVYYQMVGQGQLASTQFWISGQKYDPECANETLTIDEAEEWTLWNNSLGIRHPFHIHQNPFQLLSQSDRGTYKHPVWRDTLAIPTATVPATIPPRTVSFLLPNANPQDPATPWGQARIRYVAKEFTGAFVNHCHILGHEDRGMMHNTQSTCPDGKWATTSAAKDPAACDAQGFCPSDCVTGKPIDSTPRCPAPPPQQSDWPKAYGYPD